MGKHGRSFSFHEINAEQATGVLSDILRENDVFLGGSSMGKGLKKAAQYYLQERSAACEKKQPVHLSLPGAIDLNPDCEKEPLEEAFYIVDLGVVVSQVYQCKFFSFCKDETTNILSVKSSYDVASMGLKLRIISV
jgi:hypothetical protein